MKSNIIGAAFGFWAAGSAGAYAEAQSAALGTVVELYTSQGCSSCPPADEYLHELAEEPGVIALALHVDYWDYIGWTDKFGQAEFTERQKAYAHVAGSNTIYTPQMIVGGVDAVEGADPAKVESALRKHQLAIPVVSLQLIRRDGHVRIAAHANPPLEAPLRVQLVRYRPSVSVKIEHGENAGRVINYTNIVTSWVIIDQWDGRRDLDLTADAAGDEPVVVILQAAGPGRIFAAAQVK